MPYAALIMSSGKHVQKKASPKAKDERPGSSEKALPGPGTNCSSFFQISTDVGSVGPRLNMETQLLTGTRGPTPAKG